MAELNDELLQTFIDQQARILAAARETRTAVGVLNVAMKKLRTHSSATRSELRALSSKVNALSEDLATHTTSIEQLEEESGRVLAEFSGLHSKADAQAVKLSEIDQAVGALTHLTASAFDLNNSTLSRVAKMKGHVVVEEAPAPAAEQSEGG